MNNNLISNILESKIKISELKNDELERLNTLFPYCEVTRIIDLIYKKVNQDMLYEKKLTDSIIHISDRKLLFSFLNKGTPLIQTEKQVRKSFQIHLLIRSQKLKDRTQKDHQFLFQVARPQNNILLTSPLIVPKSLW